MPALTEGLLQSAHNDIVGRGQACALISHQSPPPQWVSQKQTGDKLMSVESYARENRVDTVCPAVLVRGQISAATVQFPHIPFWLRTGARRPSSE